MIKFSDIGSTEKQAKIKYLDGEFEIIKDGQYVLCAVSGNKISLNDLKYWSVERQEAYFDAEHSLTRDIEINRD